MPLVIQRHFACWGKSSPNPFSHDKSCGFFLSPWYRQVLCANSFTSLAELSLHRAGKPALNYLIAEDRERVKGGEAACEALDVNSVFCYQPACLPASQCASCSCTFFRPIGFRRHDAVWRIPASKPNDHQEKCLLRVSCAGSRDSDAQ